MAASVGTRCLSLKDMWPPCLCDPARPGARETNNVADARPAANLRQRPRFCALRKGVPAAAARTAPVPGDVGDAALLATETRWLGRHCSSCGGCVRRYLVESPARAVRPASRASRFEGELHRARVLNASAYNVERLVLVARRGRDARREDRCARRAPAHVRARRPPGRSRRRNRPRPAPPRRARSSNAPRPPRARRCFSAGSSRHRSSAARHSRCCS